MAIGIYSYHGAFARE